MGKISVIVTKCKVSNLYLNAQRRDLLNMEYNKTVKLHTIKWVVALFLRKEVLFHPVDKVIRYPICK